MLDHHDRELQQTPSPPPGESAAGVLQPSHTGTEKRAGSKQGAILDSTNGTPTNVQPQIIMSKSARPKHAIPIEVSDWPAGLSLHPIAPSYERPSPFFKQMATRLDKLAEKEVNRTDHRELQHQISWAIVNAVKAGFLIRIPHLALAVQKFEDISEEDLGDLGAAFYTLTICGRAMTAAGTSVSGILPAYAPSRFQRTSLLSLEEEVREDAVVCRLLADLIDEAVPPTPEVTAPAIGLKPEWDGENLRLTYDGNIIREYSPRAKRCIPVLDAFQTAGWPERIPDPGLQPVVGGANFRKNPEQISGACASLNKGQSAGRFQIRFSAGGNGMSFLWKLIETGASE
jgi:hypothetical protein